MSYAHVLLIFLGLFLVIHKHDKEKGSSSILEFFQNSFRLFNRGCPSECQAVLIDIAIHVNMASCMFCKSFPY